MELRPRVLVMTSSGETRQRLAALLAGAEYRVEPCEVGADTGRCLRSDLSLVLVDLSLTDVDPVDFVRRTATRNASIKQLVLSARGDYERIIAVIRAGAHGCVFRDAPDAELLAAIREVLDGGRPIARDIGGMLFEHVRRSRPPSRERRAVRPLTERERGVLEQLARGLEYEDIGRLLGVSINTVRSYVRAIYEKLSVNSRTEAVVAGMKLGLVKNTHTPFPSPSTSKPG